MLLMMVELCDKWIMKRRTISASSAASGMHTETTQLMSSGRHNLLSTLIECAHEEGRTFEIQRVGCYRGGIWHWGTSCERCS